MNGILPVEVLIKVFSKLERDELRPLLLVNKLWCAAARVFADNEIHLTLTETNDLHEDLSKFPLLAPRVAKIVIQSNDTISCFLTLNLCPNIAHLSFGDECSSQNLLACLGGSKYTLLPKLQEIELTGICEKLWACLWKHRATITRINALPPQSSFHEYARDLPELISHFPQVEVLDALPAPQDVNLYRLLFKGKKLRKIKLSNAFYKNEGGPDDNLLSNLHEFGDYGSVHIYAVLFLILKSSKPYCMMRKNDYIEVDDGQDKDEILGILSRIHKKCPAKRDDIWEGFSGAKFIWKNNL